MDCVADVMYVVGHLRSCLVYCTAHTMYIVHLRRCLSYGAAHTVYIINLHLDTSK